MQIFNTMSRKKEELKTKKPKELKFYSCGPTVYGLIHVGNLRSALVSDMFYRYWKSVGYKVDYARNYTDVDDKIINKAKEEGVSPKELADKYISEVEKDFKAAGIAEPSYKPRVTETMPEIIQLIQDIIKQGKGYVVGSDVLFSVDRFEGYGKLSGKALDQLEAGARVSVKEEKENPLDFYLWKASKEGEPFWESPWGKGRPGWHIECSAMIRKLMGDEVDVHHGGVDLVFPHHENELAQSEAGTGHSPFARYWMHHAFVTIKDEKMSKSLGNIFSAREFLEKFSGELARFLVLSPHYRSPIDFSANSLSSAVTALERIYEAKKLAEDLVAAGSSGGKVSLEFQKTTESLHAAIAEAWEDDFHTPKVTASVFDCIREFNKIAYEGGSEDRRANAEHFLQFLESELKDVLGFGQMKPDLALEELHQIRKRIEGLDGEETVSLDPAKIDQLLVEREQARQSKNFKRADEIRDLLLENSIEIKDTPLGPKWSRH